MKLKIIVTLMLLFSLYISAQNCTHTFTGKVEDFHDKSPIVNAIVVIKSQNKYATTDVNGNFEIKNVCSGKAIIEVSHISCDTKQIEINFNKDITRIIDLEHHIENIDEVNVKSTNKLNTVTTQSTLIKTKTIEKYSSLSLGDALKEVSGVSSINTGSSIVKPIINGLHSSRVLIMNNGVRLQDQEWGIEHAPNIDINIASQISVIKGSGALAYGGDAIGGVVIINPSKFIRKDTIFGKTITDGQNNGRGYNISSTLNKNYTSGWFGQIQGSYKKNGDFKTPDYFLTNTGLDSKGISARLGKKTFESGFEAYYSYLDNEIGILRSAHIGNVVNLRDAINSPVPLFTNDLGYDIIEPKQEVKHHLLKASYYKRFKNFGKIDIQYDYQNNRRFEFDIRRGGRSIKPAVDLELQTHTLSVNTKIDKNLDRKYNFGLMGRYQDHFASPETGVRRLIPDYNKYDFGAFINTEWRLNDNLIADAGLRYDFSSIDAFKFYRTSKWEERGYNVEFPDLVTEVFRNQVLTNPTFNFHNMSGALGLRYNFNDNNYILGNYTLSSRAPNPSELFSDGVHHSAARYEIGDLRIDSERSNRISGTYGYTNSKFNFQVEAYHNYINDFIYLIPSSGATNTTTGVSPSGIVQIIRGTFPSWEFIQTNATLFGVDISLNYEITPSWKINHKSAFIKGYDKKTDLPLIDIPPFNTTNGITYTNTKWYNFNANIQSEWAFKQNEFPTEYNYTVPIANAPNIEVDLSPPPGYHLMHFQSEITIPAFKKSSLNIRFSVDNLFNTNYRNYLNRFRFFADDLGRNFRIQLQLNY